ncbi:galactosyltransferase-related protein [Streptomyces sp. NBC_01239]|uniref:galactosyltransferase-related protein n=1 Tax=Streptomyces sp. NBC_01239 TaxID=2903792 RepID=UPI00224EE602|nr:galactosyltransferase-related protein [Streptomyces sp. NBC_01239]MCX4816752.1 galactosyltransferase-related protein [Streptomyces sp. NBC_01239]MCX4818200.1 galactosyltransferase-related protein [Streptomyces sp. NBC_01239]
MERLAGPVTVTVVIPWRPGTAERNAHHEYVRARLATLLPDAIHLDVDSGHMPFSRAGSRNEGVQRAEAAGADVVVICDADTLPEPEPLHAAIAAAADGVLHLPYTWFRGLSQQGTSDYLAGLPADSCATDLAHEWATGGVLVIQPASWWAMGGMDERFVGWGFEDAAARICADALLGPTVRHDGAITHLWHPQESGLGSPQHVANGRLCQRYVDATGEAGALRAIVAERATVPA